MSKGSSPRRRGVVVTDRYCRNCGRRFGQEWSYCPGCGTPRLSAGRAKAQPVPTSTPEEILASLGDEEEEAMEGPQARGPDPVREAAHVPSQAPDDGTLQAIAEPTGPVPRETAAPGGQPEVGALARFLGGAFAVALIGGVCLALGLSAQATFWVLVVLAMVTFRWSPSSGKAPTDARRSAPHARPRLTLALSPRGSR
jgi:hypothetical protein